MNDEDLGLIKINFAKFKEIYEKTSEDICENLIKKSNDLTNNYNCFVSNYDAKSLWEKKKLIAQKKTSKVTTARVRPRIILIDFSDEAKCKKEFTSYLNKLTDLNKDVIYFKIKNFIKEVNENIINNLFDVLINFIKYSSNNIYIDVLYLFDENFISNNINIYCNNFLTNREWLPLEIVIDYKILYHNDNYDKYCSYIKLKKSCISIIKALLIINKKINNMNYISLLLNEIFIDITKHLNNTNFKHIVELLLDELIIILDYVPKKEIINNILNWDLSIFEHSTKFKIMKIIDKYKS